jgi:hypothetical protein
MRSSIADHVTMGWREHLRIVAILVNGLSVLFLVGASGWWMPLEAVAGWTPLMAPPLIAVVALAVNGRRRPDA